MGNNLVDLLNWGRDQKKQADSSSAVPGPEDSTQRAVDTTTPATPPSAGPTQEQPANALKRSCVSSLPRALGGPGTAEQGESGSTGSVEKLMAIAAQTDLEPVLEDEFEPDEDDSEAMGVQGRGVSPLAAARALVDEVAAKELAPSEEFEPADEDAGTTRSSGLSALAAARALVDEVAATRSDGGAFAPVDEPTPVPSAAAPVPFYDEGEEFDSEEEAGYEAAGIGGSLEAPAFTVDELLEPERDSMQDEYEPEPFEPEEITAELYEPEPYEPEPYEPELYEPELYEPEQFESEGLTAEPYESEQFEPEELTAAAEYDPEPYAPRDFAATEPDFEPEDDPDQDEEGEQTFTIESGSNGDVLTVTGRPSALTTIAIPGYGISAASFDAGRLSIDLGSGESFAIEYSDVDRLAFADETAIVLKGSHSEEAFEGSASFVEDYKAFAVRVAGGGTVEWEYDAVTDTLAILGTSGTSASTAIKLVDRNGDDLSIGEVNIDSPVGTLVTNMDIDTVSIHGGVHVPDIAVNRGAGEISELRVSDAVSRQKLRIHGRLRNLAAAGCERADIEVSGDVGSLSVNGRFANSRLTVGGDLDRVHVAAFDGEVCVRARQVVGQFVITGGFEFTQLFTAVTPVLFDGSSVRSKAPGGAVPGQSAPRPRQPAAPAPQAASPVPAALPPEPELPPPAQPLDGGEPDGGEPDPEMGEDLVPGAVAAPGFEESDALAGEPEPADHECSRPSGFMASPVVDFAAAQSAADEELLEEDGDDSSEGLAPTPANEYVPELQEEFPVAPVAGLSSSPTEAFMAANGVSAAAKDEPAPAAEAKPVRTEGMVTMGASDVYTFSALDFSFGDYVSRSLTQLKVMELGAGTLMRNERPVTRYEIITRSDVDEGKLAYMPAAGVAGSATMAFRFKPHDGTEYSQAVYTILAAVTPS